jgi:hypothetical protein
MASFTMTTLRPRLLQQTSIFTQTDQLLLRRPGSNAKKERENRKRKTLLTHTGLLMEGVESRHSGRRYGLKPTFSKILAINETVYNARI